MTRSEKLAIIDYFLEEPSVKPVVEEIEEIAESVDNGDTSWEDVEAFLKKCHHLLTDSVYSGDLD